MKGVKDGKYSIELLIVVKEPTLEMKEKAKIARVELLSFKAVCALGKSAIKPFVVRVLRFVFSEIGKSCRSLVRKK